MNVKVPNTGLRRGRKLKERRSYYQEKRPVQRPQSWCGWPTGISMLDCVGKRKDKLSFKPGAIITGVRPSLEPGWLEATLEGKVGLVPETNVEVLP